MFTSSRILNRLRNKSFSLISVVNVKSYSIPSGQNFHQKEENFKRNRFNNDNYAKYVAIAASLLGVSVYSCTAKVYAFNKESVKCGEYREDLKTYKLEEVGKHDSREKRVWVTFKQGVYDITDFIDMHPGGQAKILLAAGSAIEPYWSIFANHNVPDIYELLETMRIGNISKEDAEIVTSNKNDPYAKEPTRHKDLIVRGHKPFCAESPPQLLVQDFLTPMELFFVRGHLPVPDINLNSYSIELSVENDVKKMMNFEDVKKYPKHVVTCAVMCGGNRRSEMAKEKELKGINWTVGAIGNAKWSGARLCDILKDLGINEDEYDHVQFEGYDFDPTGSPYGASIPISKAMDPRSDVILAYEMNDKPISRDHGFPIRVIVPGVVGARNVKWLAKIIVSKEECQSQWQQNDYKGFSPSTNWNNVDFSKSPAIQDMPVTSAICTPQSSETVKVIDGKIHVKGYAWSGGGRKIIRVDVTNDQGKTWHTANLYAEDNDAKEGRYWSWTLWDIDLPVSKELKETEIWAKAVDASYNVQPENFKNIWNLRGLLCNAYHRVNVKLAHEIL